MSSLPTFSEMASSLDMQDSSPASASSLDNPTPATAFHSHTIPQTVPTISVPILQSMNMPAGSLPMSVPMPSTDMYGWLPSPASSVFNFQPTFPSLDNTSNALGFSAVSTFPSFGYNFLPQNLTQQPTPSHHRSRSHCNPADIFGMTPTSGSTNLGFDLEMTDGTSLANSTNIASPCSSESSSSAPSSEEKTTLKKEKKNAPTKLVLSMTSKTAPVPLVFGEDDGADGADGDAPGPKKRSRTAQACERCRIRKARCFGGNPCNRCIKRKFVCEFTPTRQRGPNKPRSPEMPVHQPLSGNLKSKARRHSMHAVASSSTINTSIAGRYAPIRSRPPAIAEAAPTIGLGLELTPPADDDAPSAPPPRKLSAAAIRQAAELERLTGGAHKVNAMINASPLDRITVPHVHTHPHSHVHPHPHPHAHHVHSHVGSSSTGSGSGSTSNSVIGSGWTMIGGGDLGTSAAWAEEDLFRFSPESSSAGNTGVDEFASNFEFPWTPNSPQSMSQSFTTTSTGGFELAQSELLNLRDDALRQLYGSVPITNESEWFTAY